MPRVALSKLSDKSYGPRDYIQGMIMSLKDYSAQSQRAQLSLQSEPLDPEHSGDDIDDDDDTEPSPGPDRRVATTSSGSTSVEVHLVGPWAAQVQGRFDIGLKVRLSLHRAAIRHVEGRRSCKLLYSNGVSFDLHRKSGNRVKFDVLGSGPPVTAADSTAEFIRYPAHDQISAGPSRTEQSSPSQPPTAQQHSKENAPLPAAESHKRPQDTDGVFPTSNEQGSKSKKNRASALGTAVAPAHAVCPPPPKRKPRTAWGLVTTGVEYRAERRFEYLPFSEIEQSKNQRHLDVMAIVLSVSSIGKTDGKDYKITLDLSTPDYDQPLTAEYFAPSPNDVVNPEIGDVVILQRMNWSKDRRRFIGYSDNHPRSAVLKRAALLRDSNTAEAPIMIGAQSEKTLAIYGKAEIDYAKDMVRADCSAASAKTNLANSLLATTGTTLLPSISRKPKASGRKMTKIMDMRPDVFCDTVVQILRIYAYGNENLKTLGPNEPVSIYVTDFTENDLLYDFDDQMEDGLPGQYVLQVSIFGCQAQPLDQLMRPGIGKKPGQGRAVHLVNLRPKLNPNGYLEATIMPDRKYERKRDVILLGPGSASDPWLVDIHKRRLAYQAAQAAAEPVLAPIFVAPIGIPSDRSAAPAESARSSHRQSAAHGPDPELTYSMSRMISSDLVGDFRVRARVVHFFPEAVRWVLAYCAEPSCRRKLPANKDSCLEHPGAAFNLRYFFHFELVDESLQGKTIAVKFDSDSDWAGFLPNLPPVMGMRRDTSTQSLELRQRFDEILGGVTSLHHRGISNVPEQNWGPPTKWIIHKTASGEYLVGEGMRFQ
ncbi:BZ3500_MvSof-1268-A1-R1_Chr3-2g06280 [Microbotryum saponariae]|uniref:Protection of telomeres protein 1 n=1 Tax=Microbotryum saponariae TaxID=289078 RepID=A0A2X0L0I6_9BASI|nr:BZ3500_MvSof-1268-A1-R1_Chr3-2g06280 [Microbotryum saponariae]SDA04251.1 BZ3501_MvSof-1269-A2-R1_Chr3-2g05971 [Microbotryum saponariae]